MANIKVVVSDSGPYRLAGEFRLITVERTEVVPRSSALCRCGASGSKPYCDGSHAPSEFGGAHDQEPE